MLNRPAGSLPVSQKAEKGRRRMNGVGMAGLRLNALRGAALGEDLVWSNVDI
jgi:hypothetical protein